MEKTDSITLSHRIIKFTSPFLIENKKLIAQFIFTIFFLAIGIWFIKHERAELGEIKHVLLAAQWYWLVWGIGLSVAYILVQALMYRLSFASINSHVSYFDSLVLFLKRNLISVFLPAGGVSALAFFTGPIEKNGITKTQIYFASIIYGFIGISSVVLVAFPAFIYAILEGEVGYAEWIALGVVLVLIISIYQLYQAILQKGKLYGLVVKWIPVAEIFFNDLQSNIINRKKFLFTVLVSVVIEFIGISTLYLAIAALHGNPSIYAAVMGYLTSVLFLIVSPFLRGLGAIEVSMSYVLVRFGFGNVEAIAITFFYRFFEFWVPLFVGVLTFLSKINKLLMRIVPALFIMGLGIVNLVSVLTPAISERLMWLKEFLPTSIINASDYLVLTAGLFLLITSAFMLKGLRAAWWFAIVLSLLSFVGHLTKAIDFEESIFALIMVAILLATRKEYYIKTNPKILNVGIQTALLLTVVTLIYGVVGFYFLEKKHFNIDFSLIQSLRFTIQNYFLVGSGDIIPGDLFARHFLLSINVSGFLSMAFLIYAMANTYKAQNNVSDDDRLLACRLLESFGNSSLDYFKTYHDKLIFYSNSRKSFIAYRVSGSFAIALEKPVAENPTEMKTCIQEFDTYCYENGLKSIFYRVPEESLSIFRELKKKELFLGQEGVVDVSAFTIQGGSKKSMRNAINKVSEQGYKCYILQPPIKDGVLQKLKSVSDEWLADTGRSEIVFSQGMFNWDELKQQTIITVENSEEKIIAFLNIIPNFVKGEATYDLLRKTIDAPNGVMDFILIELINYLKLQNITHLNLGFAPMSGLDDPHTFPEKSMKFAYQKIKSFSHYKGMREYKEKFEPEWYNKYLVFQHDYDLLKVPMALADVIKV